MPEILNPDETKKHLPDRKKKRYSPDIGSESEFLYLGGRAEVESMTKTTEAERLDHPAGEDTRMDYQLNCGHTFTHSYVNECT